MNAALCWLGVLDEHLLQSALDPQTGGGRRFIFQQDGDPSNAAKVSKEWLQDSSEWPNQSPLNKWLHTNASRPT